MTLKLNGTNSEAAPAYAGDDADTGLQCGTNELKLVTGGSARATVDSSGNVGIGTTSNYADSKLEVRGTNAGGDVAIRVTNNSTTTGTQAGLIFTTTTADFTTAGIGYERGDDALKFYVGQSAGGGGFDNATERIRIDSSGTLKLVSSGGIDFSGIQTNVSGMTSETLDSYEEGTHTITTNSNLTSDSNYQNWYYTKIGRKVTISGLMRVSSVSSTDNVFVSLPFASADHPTNGTSSYTGQVMHYNVNTENNGLAWFISGNSSEIRFYQLVDNGAWSRLNNGDLAGSDEMYMTCTYFTA